MSESNNLPDHIQEEIRNLPESSYGANRVVVTLDDGTEVRDVYVAWGKEIVKVGNSQDIPFEVSRIVNVRHQP
jgi:hypothetical protein